MKGGETVKNEKQVNKLFEECYGGYHKQLINYCLARLSGDREKADDCVHDAFTVFYERLKAGEEFENPRAFLYRTAENFVRRQNEKTAKEAKNTVSLDDVEISTETEFFRIVEETDFEKLAKEILSALTETEKEIYTLRYDKKMGVEEMAKQMGVSRPAMSMKLMRLRNKIKEIVYNTDFEKGGKANGNSNKEGTFSSS
ncbi:MAG: sigma-70 family RNA polymerase sigma factor [Ruminococcaceae bacterium]|nr:sigma-70 family RNA polymerase sigma factor [Oscillospiraceae bacterium]